MRKRSRSLRGQLFAMMAIIAIVECVVLMLTVALSGVFTQLDGEAFRFFASDAAERAATVDNGTGRLIQNTVTMASAVSTKAQDLAKQAGQSLEEAYRSDEFFNQIISECGNYVIEFVNGNAVSAAFVVLNGSNTHKDDPDAHSAVYIRNMAPDTTSVDPRNLQLEVGPSSVARDHKISTADRWDLDMKFPEESDAFYSNPISACLEYPRSELVRYGYWSPPTKILPNTQECVSYTLPLQDASGNPWGVMGFEISLSYFVNEFLSSTNLPFQGSFFAITSGGESELDTEWMIPGSPTATTYLQPNEIIPIRPVEGTSVHETDLPELGPTYCTVNELTMYSKNSPFADQKWLFTGMVRQSVLNESSTRIGTMLLTNMIIMLGAAFVAIFLLTFLSSRKIVGLSQYINELEPGADIKFVRTDLREIDDLTAAIEQLNRRVNDSLKVTSKMMELTQLPLGGFEVSNDLDRVMLTEYIYSLLHLKQGEPVSKSEWQYLFSQLTAHPAEGYSDVYCYDPEKMFYGEVLAAEKFVLPHGEETDVDNLYQYPQWPEEKQKWLRIIESPVATGTVGMILDSTADIEERMRLAHDLDYDALTHLYNRTAFKREAFKMIKENPSKVGAMIFSDLDNLKRINDTYGHLMGDKLITTAADMFREFTKYRGIVARISGDEFAIFLHGFDSKEEILKIVGKLYRGYRDKHFETPDGKTQWISCSSGLAWYPDDSTDAADLLKLSDYAMYEAKKTKKGSFYQKGSPLFEHPEEAAASDKEEKERREDLRRLIDQGLFRFKFQPIVDLGTKEIYGYEALMRPQTQSMKTPAEVLETARRESLLGELENVLVPKAFDVVKENKEAIGTHKIFINSVPGQRLSKKTWSTIRQSYADVLPDIIFEVKESENDDLETMLSKLQEMRKLGIPVAIDNFGEGYANEVRIIAMQPAIIKLDLKLIQNLHADAEKQKTVSTLISFAHQQGVKVAAEGVEMETDLEEVIHLGFDFAQGTLLGKPEFGFQKLSEDVKRKL